MRYVVNVIVPVDRQHDVYWPVKIQKSYRPTVVLNVIATLPLCICFCFVAYFLKSKISSLLSFSAAVQLVLCRPGRKPKDRTLDKTF